MDIFERIDENENLYVSEEELLEKKIINIQKNRKQITIEVTPLTYALINNKPKVISSIIKKIKEQDNIKNLVDEILNKNILRIVKFEPIWSIVEELSSYFNSCQKIRFRSLILMQRDSYGIPLEVKEKMENLDQYLPAMKEINIEDLKELRNYNNNYYSFDKILDLELNNVLLLFKKRMRDNELYNNFINIFSSNDKNILILKNIVDEIDNHFFKIENEKEMDDFFSNTLPKIFLNKNGMNIIDIIYKNGRYLLDSSYYNKLIIYEDLLRISKRKSKKNLMNKMLSFCIEEKRLMSEDETNIEELKNLCKNKNLKNISIEKTNDLKEIIEMLKEGAAIIEKVYGLAEKDFGAGRLSIHVNRIHYKEKDKLKASCILGDDLIKFNALKLKNINAKTFIHEYTHYLQGYQDLNTENLSVSESKINAEKNLTNNKEWRKIKNIIKSHKVTMDYAIDGALSCLKKYQYDENEIEQLKIILKNVFIKKDFIKIETLMEQLNEININKNIFLNFDEEILIKDINYIQSFYKAYYSMNYFETLWKEIDIIEGKNYWSLPIEIHARLVEGLIKENIIHVDNLCSGEKIYNQIKPILYELNKSMSKNYKKKISEIVNNNMEYLLFDPITTSLNSSLEQKIVNKIIEIRHQTSTISKNLFNSPSSL